MKFEFFVALRYLKAKRKQTMVSVISAISVLGIAAGVMALVIALALSTGFKEDIQSKILGATSAINLLRIDNTPVLDYQELLKKIGTPPHVIGSAPAVFNKVFIASSSGNVGAALKGIDPVREKQVSDFFSHVASGDPNALQPKNSQPDRIMIGKEMARILGAKPGGRLKVFYPMGRLTPLGMAPAERTFIVGAIFDTGLYDIDSSWAYVHIDAARRLFAFPAGSASFIQFKTDNLDNVDPISDDISVRAGEGFITTTWAEINKPLFSALKLEKIVLFLTIGLIVLVASLNIVTTLIMMVLEKQGDIAILAAMGATAKTIHKVFLFQGLIIGLIGTVLGDILGIGICWFLNAYKVIRLEAEIYSIPYVPFHLSMLDVLIVSVTAILISFLATIYPARSAAKLDPVEALRYE
jgi:lipoprotein-releasing system permease protein